MNPPATSLPSPICADNPGVTVENFTTEDLDALNGQLSPLDALDRLKFVYERFGVEPIAFTSSFGAMSAGLIHLVSLAAPGSTVYFLDTGFHFPETLRFRDAVMAKVNLNLEIIRPETPKSQLFYSLGSEPYRSNPNQCCFINKVEPMRKLLQGKLGWVSGVRRGQTDHRNQMQIVDLTQEQKLKIHPILDWSKKQLYDYIETHQLPIHPLWEKGYISIGCGPCTSAVDPNVNDERAGRWVGMAKTECGLHFI